jgi:type I restriction enzyme M protein
MRHFPKKGEKPFVAGLDKDQFLARIANSYLSILLREPAKVFCENSLSFPSAWNLETQKQIQLESFDLVLTNPPFGAKIPVLDKKILGQYELGHVTEKSKRILREKQPPQVLFIERCVQLLKPGGRMGIVLPEGIFGNPSDKYIWDFLESRGDITGIVSLAQESFQPSTHTKTSVLFFKKEKTNSPIFMASAVRVGHNKNGKTLFKFDLLGNPLNDENGNPIIDDDLPAIAANFKEHEKSKSLGNHLGFSLRPEEVMNQIYIPDYYNPELQMALDEIESSGSTQFMSVGDLLEKKWISIKRGKEIGSHLYGTGPIPFVRTSDITNWEIKFDPIKSVSVDAYEKFRKSMDVLPGDIFMVSDGTFLIGRTAMVTEETRHILYQSHLKKIRVLPGCPFDANYLLYLLSTEIVQRQIRAKTFVQATISTLGERLLEVRLPVARDQSEIELISLKVSDIMKKKSQIRNETIALIGDPSFL